MSEDNAQHSKGWLDTLIEGGLPQLIAGPAGKAISRLVGAAVEIPAARLDQKAQAIKDETKARSDLMQALAAKSAELGVSDPALLDRGLTNLLGKAYRDQQNREAVARKTIDLLVEEPAPAESEGPSDDWLNVFEEHAGRASSEALRDTWARILAGEIRKPRTFSLATLHLVSILDKTVADAAEAALGHAFNGKFAKFGSVRNELLDKLAVARSAGIIPQIDSDITITVTTNEHGVAGFWFGDVAIQIVAPAGASIPIECVALTRTGQELLSVIRPSPSEDGIEALITEMQGSGLVTEIRRGIAVRQGDSVSARDLKSVWLKN